MCEVLRLFIKTTQLNCVKEGRAVWNKNEWQVSPENLLLHNVFSWHFRQPTAKGFFFLIQTNLWKPYKVNNPIWLSVWFLKTRKAVFTSSKWLVASWLATSRPLGGDLVCGETVWWRDDHKPIKPTCWLRPPLNCPTSDADSKCLQTKKRNKTEQSWYIFHTNVIVAWKANTQSFHSCQYTMSETRW